MEVDSTFGALFIGAFISSILYGFAVLQTFYYYREYPRDSRVLRIAVAAIMIFTTAQLSLNVAGLYVHLVKNYMGVNPDAYTTAIDLSNISSTLGGFIASISQFFFAHRLWTFSSNIYMSILVVFLSVLHFVSSVASTGIGIHDINKLSTDFSWLVPTSFSIAASVDVLIAGTLVFYLSKNRGGIARTNSIISKLIMYTLCTGLGTCINALVCIITYAIMPNNLGWMAAIWTIGQLYANSMLAALNVRESLRSEGQSRPDESTLVRITRFRHVEVFSETPRTQDHLQSRKSSDFSDARLAGDASPLGSNSKMFEVGHGLEDKIE